jgi:hypothetical protein
MTTRKATYRRDRFSKTEKASVAGLSCLMQIFHDGSNAKLKRLAVRVANQACAALCSYGYGCKPDFLKYRAWCRRNAILLLNQKAPWLELDVPAVARMIDGPKPARKARAS